MIDYLSTGKYHNYQKRFCLKKNVMEHKRLEDNVEGSQPKSNSPQNIRLVILLGIIYTIFQALLFFLPIEPAEDYFNHINWGIGYYDDNLYPYRDFNANEYPALSVWGWMLAYRISPNNTYEILSIIMILIVNIHTLSGKRSIQ